MRCAHRSVLVVVHAACLCCWLFFFCCLDFSSFSNGHVILEKLTKRIRTSSKLCAAYDTCVPLPRKKPRAREIRWTLQGCCLRRIRLSMPLPRHAALRGLPLHSVFSDQNVNFKHNNNVTPAFFFSAEPRCNRSVVLQKILPNSKVKKVDKAPVGATSFFA